jgi:hypothetical protein
VGPAQARREVATLYAGVARKEGTVKHSIRIIAATAAVALVALAAPAFAADTSISFAITAGSLSISAPASSDLGSVAAGSASLSGTLGNVTVTDNRGAAAAAWTATVAAVATPWCTGTCDSTSKQVPGSDITYTDNSFGTTSGTCTTRTPGPGGVLSADRTAASVSGCDGTNSATWNPTIALANLADNLAGSYTGTLTHTVA